MDWITIIAVVIGLAATVHLLWANKQINRELWEDPYLKEYDERKRKK